MTPLSRIDDLAAMVPQERTNPLKISVVVDNRADGARYLPEHGLSLYLEVAGRRILFDSGAGDAIVHNARQLKIKLDRLTDLVISHSHYDHTGGIPTILELNPAIRIFAHPELFNPRYNQDDLPPNRQIGLTQETNTALRRHVANIVWTPTPTPIAEGVWVTGAIPRRNQYEDVGGPFYLDENCTRPDLLEGDQAIWVQTPKGIVVIVGCAHAGIVNTLDRIARLTKSLTFHAVIGGLHLMHANPARLQYTLDALDRYQVARVGPCHCTGDAAHAYLRRNLGNRYVEIEAGLKLSF